ncbi:MAG: EscU/YscU/HrcU family type III secretion system export apparatus switch protein [Oligoflexia bacterium]|nr:EscU/YscU/HrcU family type III secretion system export apparatus switch protein [Oligoflexia bacterium]
MTNAHKLAVGLSYGGCAAPSLSCRGEFLAADEIVRLARRFGVSVVEHPELARALDPLELDQEIPRELFEAVAVLLAELGKL